MRALLILGFLLAQARAQTPAVPKTAVDSQRERLATDMRTKNTEDLLSLYTIDAVFIQPDGTQVAGLPALRALYESVFQTYDSDLHFGGRLFNLDTVDFTVIESGDYTEALRNRGTKRTVTVCGQYSFTWRTAGQSKPDARGQSEAIWLLVRQQWFPPEACPAPKP